MSPRIQVTVEEVELEGDNGREVPGVCVTCSKCEHAAEVFGRSDASIRRGCVMLREECPEGEENFYEIGDGEEPQS